MEVAMARKSGRAALVLTPQQRPTLEGLAASALARFVSKSAEAAGFARLSNAGKSTVWRILDEHEIKPHKIRYYLEKRDPEFDRKM
jgi:hypothetical protein